ncbi:MAG TPA: DsrE/DsrF/DrsH-like family protein [Solirubrobacteraceae bacterium]|jgi:predicted peroxiredoxin|nr:DsrE/DsrF/DrsH-like family protein [Solirubrobacteraceae bacterium]
MSDDEESVLYVMTHGLEAPERCATPFFLASTAAAMDLETGIYFTMNGPQLLKKGVAETIGPKGEEGQKLAFFIDQALDCGVSLYVCQPSLDLNDLTPDDLIDGVKMIGGAAFNDMAMEARAVVTF